MKYSEDTQKASEITRLILPALAQLEIPMNPINYALWYEYNLGRNEELTDTIDKIVDGTEPYDEKTAFELFINHVLAHFLDMIICQSRSYKFEELFNEDYVIESSRLTLV